MTASELIKRTEETSALTQLWAATIGNAPEAAQFHRWLRTFGFDITVMAIERTARKSAALQGGMGTEYQQRYCTSVARNAKQRAEETRRKHSYPAVTA